MDAKQVKRKRGNINCVQDAIDLESGVIFYNVYNFKNDLLFVQSKRIFQKYSRNVADALAYRWESDKPCCSLNAYNVKVKDGIAFLPEESTVQNRKDYAEVYLEFLQSVYGTSGFIRAREDLFKKLLKRNLTVEEFRNLYFHMFLQTEEELADFPERAVANLRYRKVTYNGRKYSWEGAYQAWERQKYNENFNLFYSSMSDLLVFRVYCFSTYLDDPVDEAVLVRNVIVHLNQWLKKSTPPSKLF